MCHVVELAAAEVSENPQASEALREFAAVRPNDAEQRGHDVLVKHELSCPVEINKVDLSDTKRFKNWPYIKFPHGSNIFWILDVWRNSCVLVRIYKVCK